MSTTHQRQNAQVQEEEPTTDGEETPATGGTPPVTALPLDQVFDVLKNERRRLVLRYLKRNDQPVSTSDLAEHVAAHETGKSIEQISSDERKRAYVGLYQCHLPKMDSMDVVEFNKSRGIVRLGENGSCVDPYLGGPDPGADQNADVWARRYLGLSGVSLGLLVLTTVAAPPVATTVGFALVSLAFCVTSALHCRDAAEYWLPTA
ncbi:DUF7344 domain-containing protein [Halorarius halobius]|uniref:DUF7344 domain-containing protein n=1 Tax=Halorarius halobius TaxID=2962671 RepID=UPI0020CEEC11|nr:hypothetical protein [Halorarius halobius]